MEQLIIKWKHWYWYLALLFNIAIPALIAVDRKVNNGSGGSGSMLMLCIAPSLVFPLLLVYMYYTMREFKACREIIKDDRFGFFWKGVLASFISFNLFIISLVVSWKAQTAAAATVGYTALAFTCILGVASGACLSWYEFCVNWDIFYNKNKETIIASYLSNKKARNI
ncbi:hypothetical protein A6V39_03100 [Candidatus Mycoplasma haematobovis]|uniref:Uncharacterized protein n=1 Tax=Candidatus Mycoplasma haematobovis TaxID=432608 RepID=A0A1A9QEL8_9MOLU|nr:hypothetical protein [Candidatus Mycoplasma haematobovis]OAL10396.1 hypothetical protein A6V39_03100 [Candidatus Mycoplasma haematobovis]